MNKVTVRKASVLVLLMAAMVFFSFAAEAGQIMITNAVGGEISSLYLSDSGENEWEEDLLGNNTLDDGDSLRVTVQGSYDSFDLRAEDDEGNAVEWYGFPGNVTRITLKDDGTAAFK